MKKVLLSLVALCLAGMMSAQNLFSEDFEGCTVTNGIGSLPTGWVTYGDGLTNYSSYTSFGDTWNVTTLSGNKVAVAISYVSGSSTQRVDRWLVTPQINLDSADNSLMFNAYGYSTSYAESLRVLVSTTGNTKADFTDTILDVASLPNTSDNQYSIDLSAYRGQSVYIAFQLYSMNAYYGFLDNVVVGVPPTNQFSLTAASTGASFVPQNTNFNVSGTVHNDAFNAITSYVVTYNIDGGAYVANDTVSCNIPVSGTHNFTHSVPGNLAACGAHTVNVMVSYPNGVADDTTDNMASVNFTIYDASNTVARTSLLEHFTTTRCPNCPSGHDRVHAALATRPNVVWMCHHAGYYTDVMTTNDDETLCWFYNSSVNGGTYAPATMLDRTHFSFCDDQSPIFFPGSDVGNCIDEALSVPAFVTVNITNVAFDEASRTVTATVSGTFSADMPGARVSLYLVEDSIIASQSGGSSNYQHDNVYRASLGALYGDAIASTNAGDTYSRDYSWTMPSNYKAWRTRLVAFVNDYNSSDPTDSKVHNVAMAQNFNATYVGINEVGSSMTCTVFPNPATTVANIVADATIEEVTVVNMMGQVVYKNNNVDAESLTINTDKMAAGMYTVTVKSANGIATQRLTVVK